MARRGKKPEDYGQLSLFEEHEPEWLKPVDPLGYTIPGPDDGGGCAFDEILESRGDDPDRVSSADDDADDLVQFAAWLTRKKSGQ